LTNRGGLDDLGAVDVEADDVERALEP